METALTVQGPCGDSTDSSGSQFRVRVDFHLLLVFVNVSVHQLLGSVNTGFHLLLATHAGGH